MAANSIAAVGFAALVLGECLPLGTKRTSGNVRPMSAFGGEVDIPPKRTFNPLADFA